MPLQKVSEGKARIFAYKIESQKLSKHARVFYNPKMLHNRDISVLALKVFQEETKRVLKVADGLAATGIRGIRYALEVPKISDVFFCDLNPKAIELIKKNVRLNKIKNAHIEKKDANVFLSEHKYEMDFVDIDPFGTPVQFLDSAARAVSNKGMLAITATDTAPLSGTYLRAALRKYGAVPLRCDIQHELGIRILIANIARECAKYDKGFVPLLSVSELHYFRVFGKIKKTKSAAEENIKNIGYVGYCKSCGFRKFGKDTCIKKCENCGAKTEYAGQLWTGKIFDAEFCENVYEYSGVFGDTALTKLLETISEESEIDGFFYDLGFLSSCLKMRPPKISDVIEKLKKAGFKASRTHFLANGVRTDADIKEIGMFLKNINPL